MHIQRIALKNFKCFEEVAVDFSKITLLTGENSSGKSSLIYGILAPLQSVSFNNNSFPLYLSLNGNYVSMGGFEEVSFNHNLKNQLVINLDFSFDCKFKTSWFFDSISKSPKLSLLEIRDVLSLIVEIRQEEDLSYIINTEQEAFSVESLDGLLLNTEIYYDSCLEEISETLNEFLYDFNFISSFRLQPERTYYQSISSDKVNQLGYGYINQILDWTDEQSRELYELVAILKDLGMLYDIKPHRLSGGRFEIKVKVKSKSKWDSLADVGFGISQFLPIVVADLQLSNDSTLIMSQPEIHLHPSV